MSVSLSAAVNISDLSISLQHNPSQYHVLGESHAPDARVACTAMNPDDRPISFTMPVRTGGVIGAG